MAREATTMTRAEREEKKRQDELLEKLGDPSSFSGPVEYLRARREVYGSAGWGDPLPGRGIFGPRQFSASLAPARSSGRRGRLYRTIMGG